MDEYITCGAELGVLIDPKRRQVRLYRPDQQAVVLGVPQSILLEPEMPGFTLDMTDIWQPF